jgi:hypothetical protein
MAAGRDLHVRYLDSPAGRGIGEREPPADCVGRIVPRRRDQLVKRPLELKLQQVVGGEQVGVRVDG